ncbi:bifunctional methylenetetrahydrofolate dehydrogenase/methenyltetrahydrofolate cyclohydrolase FolD [Kordiimonas sp. SCSIO 12610]|uniref:bifunctional methylenetetrahydrofolate dehydrogenase/methenyltetrahydrofolate cyclohydrolase FolD n=1 Tax=Kordiimonas sp. SCSIO 12610 TaxID=2829597 RepID=UPI00210B475C|nr:bifunctional methylenetetrahydrofolate dehydrogenase/methenyltetrahydrofolate cyclohydrolase FolD [Kordiimonas sp. SCSIO 12610]UTW55608.1 bifunctional methylenetetrahydrofolate dehydrogenase/methenyltetrahydrofolate cyclohydrolase FolD [Kordiimonas sp. SCSIO 12610]
MTAQVIDGKAFSAKIREKVASDVTALQDKHGIKPGLAVVIVGEDAASTIYVNSKIKQTSEAGMESFHFALPDTISEADLVAKVHELNADDRVNGILVQLPLPKHIHESAVIEAIAPEKDVDGFHVINSGLLATGGKGMVPCTPLGCLLMLKDTLGDLSGMKAVVIGRSNIVGKPMAQLLLQENCTVTLAHSRTRDLAGEVKQADIVVAAVGVSELVKGDWIKKGATVIDVGMNRIPAPERGEGKVRLTGDVAYDEAAQNAAYITPVPGGVGPMTIACLLRNTVTAACRQAGLDDNDL